MKTSTFRSVLLGIVTAAIVLVAPTAMAMKLQRQNLAQLIAGSESILSGTVKTVTDGIDDSGVPYTEVTIAVHSVAKGKAKVEAEKDYTFRQFGLLTPRTMANGHKLLAVSPDGFPRWREGETVVAFMYKPASRTGLQTTAGMGQGKFSLVNGHLVNEFDNAGLFDGMEIDSDVLSSAEQNMIMNPGAVDAQVFMGLVSRAVTEGWITTGEMR
ncbi:MAG: hypothetical protein P8102_13240 [Gammaproteobacteria bacterium]